MKKNDNVIISNRYSRAWLKMPERYYRIICDGIEKEYTKIDLLSSLADKDDRTYLSGLVGKLEKKNFFNIPNGKDKIGLKQLYFSLTNRCNLDCVHCFANAGRLCETEVLSTPEVIGILDKIFLNNPASIIFSGGEPLLRKDIHYILEYTKKNYDGLIILMTNATLINEQNVDSIIKNVARIEISVDGVDEETTRKIRGKGVFEKAINAVKVLQSRNFDKISLSMVFGKENNHLREKFYVLNKQLGTRAITRAFSEKGRGKNSKQLFRKQIDFKDGNTKVCGIDEDRESIEYKKKKYVYDTIISENCCDCKLRLVINFDGEIYPCRLLMEKKYNLGNIKDFKDIEEIFISNNMETLNALENLSSLQPSKVEKCNACEVNMFCWTCLELMDTLLEDEAKFEQRCKVVKPYLVDVIWNTEYDN